MDWFRWHHGAVSDDKWPLIARKSGQTVATVVAVWAALLECASQAENRGCVDSFDAESFDALFGLEDGATQKVVAALSEGQKPRIAGGRLVNWEKRQPRRERENDLSTERVRKYRDLKKNTGKAKPDACAAVNENAEAQDPPQQKRAVSTEEDPVKRHETPLQRHETPRTEQSRVEQSRLETQRKLRHSGVCLKKETDSRFDTFNQTAGQVGNMKGIEREIPENYRSIPGDNIPEQKKPLEMPGRVTPHAPEIAVPSVQYSDDLADTAAVSGGVGVPCGLAHTAKASAVMIVEDSDFSVPIAMANAFAFTDSSDSPVCIESGGMPVSSGSADPSACAATSKSAATSTCAVTSNRAASSNVSTQAGTSGFSAVGKGGGPGMEFVELRDLYDRQGKSEAPLAGFIAYKALKKSGQFPGLARIAQILSDLAAADIHWQRGYRPNLNRFLQEQWWLRKIEPAPENSEQHCDKRKQGLEAFAAAQMVLGVPVESADAGDTPGCRDFETLDCLDPAYPDTAAGL